MKFQNPISRKNKKTISICRLPQVLHRVLSLNTGVQCKKAQEIQENKQIKGFITRNNTSAETETSRKHTYIILTPLNPTFI